MRIDLIPTARLSVNYPLGGTVPVVFDILRATSTIATFLGNGGRAVIPVLTEKEALSYRHPSRSDVILAGEKGGATIPGFEHGNSPPEYPPGLAAGKTLVLTTSNGTRAIRGAAASEYVFTGSLLNLTATVRDALACGLDIHLLCAGTNDAISLEDTLAAGLFIIKALETTEPLFLTDAALLALRLAQYYQHDPLQAMYDSRHGQKLAAMGLGRDLEWCAALDLYPFSCLYKDGVISAYITRSSG